MELLFFSVAFWAIWRRVFGGLFHWPRYAVVAVGFIAAAAPFYFVHGWWAALIAGGLVTGFWTLGHNFRSNAALVLRYGPVGIPWMVLERFEGRCRWMGWTEWAELGAGAIFGTLFWGIIQLS